jgi:hypothetical protein
MPSYNNRLNCVLPLHRRSEADKRGHKTFVRGKEGRAVRCNVRTEVAGAFRPCKDAKARRKIAAASKAHYDARRKAMKW